MARTYVSTLSPRRRWAIAGSAAGAVVLLTVGLGNPWTAGSVAKLANQPGADRVPLLSNALGVFDWSVTPGSYGAPADHATGFWVAGLVLDLGWPLLVLIGARTLAGGLAMRRAKVSLVFGVWSASTLMAALIGLIAGFVDHKLASGMRALSLPLAHGIHTGDVITLQAATMALLGAALGWLPGITAAVAYAVNRPEAAAATAENPATGDEATRTLDLAGLERIRSARRGASGGEETLTDPSSSRFFAAE